MRTSTLSPDLDALLGRGLADPFRVASPLARTDGADDRGPAGPADAGGVDAGRLRGVGAADGAGAPAAEQRAAAPAVAGEGLVLPRLAPEIPTTLLLRGGDETRAAALAQAMLAEGILQERDWCGGVVESIGRGLTRWAGEILWPGDPVALTPLTPGETPPGDLERIEIGLFWTDNLEAVSGIDTRLWRQGPGRDPQEPVGLLALQGEPTGGDRYPAERDCVVGRTVRELEAARSGLGWQLLYLLQQVLPPVLCTAGPQWAHEQARKATVARKLGSRTVRMDGRRLILPGHGVTEADFLAVVPREACEGKMRPGVIKEALRPANLAALPETLREIVARAGEVLKLAQVPQDVFRWDTHSLCPAGFMFVDIPGGAGIQIPFALRWSHDDPIPLIVDDYHHTITERDEATNLIWSQGWQVANPAALRKTVRSFRQAVTLALKACQLAELMHRDEESE